MLNNKYKFDLASLLCTTDQAFIIRHGQKHRQGQQLANRYIEGKADEYSSKRAWSSIGKQYPEGLTRGVIQVRGRR